jgi:hypothetical protein
LNEEEKKIRIAWSKCENIITATHADVLVIFDCCEAGSVGGYKSRARRPNFEYITACGEGDYTGIPGEKSFTSALIWSLNELCDQAPFTSDQLVKKTREYPHLPRDQKPELRHKEEPSEFVWIAPIGTNAKSRVHEESVHRDPDHGFIDLRLLYYKPLGVEDAKHLAKIFSKMVKTDERFAKQITMMNVSSHEDTIRTVVECWRTNVKRKSISSALSPISKSSIDESEGKYQTEERRTIS